MSSRMFAYFRILWGIIFLWIFAFGASRGAWLMIAVPLLGLAASLIWAESLKKQYPELAPKLLLGASVLGAIYAASVSLPRAYETFQSMVHEKDLNFQLHNQPPLLALQQALADYVQQTGNADGEAILRDLNSLKAKHEAGTFNSEDQKEEDRLFERAQELAQKNARLKSQIDRIQHMDNPPNSEGLPNEASGITKQPASKGPERASASESSARRGIEATSHPAQAQEVTTSKSQTTEADDPEVPPTSGDGDNLLLRLRSCRYVFATEIDCTGYIVNQRPDNSMTIRLGPGAGTMSGSDGIAARFDAWVVYQGGGLDTRAISGVKNGFIIRLKAPSGIQTVNLSLTYAPDDEDWRHADFVDIPVRGVWATNKLQATNPDQSRAQSLALVSDVPSPSAGRQQGTAIVSAKSNDMLIGIRSCVRKGEIVSCTVSITNSSAFDRWEIFQPGSSLLEPSGDLHHPDNIQGPNTFLPNHAENVRFSFKRVGASAKSCTLNLRHHGTGDYAGVQEVTFDNVPIDSDSPK